MRQIYKIGGVILRDNKLLVVRKKGTSVFIAPGGKQELSEGPLEALRRELKEELDLELESMEFFGRFADVSTFENIPIVMDVFIVQCMGEPQPGAEIEECRWIPADQAPAAIQLGSVLERHVIPELLRKGVLPFR
jgi:8-oxo-dGTP diphosphatase